MMARFKDFGSGSNSTPAEPITFKIHDEEFTCRGEIPGKVMLDLVAKSANQEDPANSAAMITDFFNYAMEEESYNRFIALAEDPIRIVTMETLTDIVGWLVEEYSDRPTSRPEVSLDGQ
jgi:hypothetical protein